MALPPSAPKSPTSLASELPPPKVAQGQSPTSTDTVSSCFLVQSVSRGLVPVSLHSDLCISGRPEILVSCNIP